MVDDEDSFFCTHAHTYFAFFVDVRVISFEFRKRNVKFRMCVSVCVHAREIFPAPSPSAFHLRHYEDKSEHNVRHL